MFKFLLNKIFFLCRGGNCSVLGLKFYKGVASGLHIWSIHYTGQQKKLSPTYLYQL